MEAAKAAVFKHLSKDGKHQTDVEEHVAPAIQHEHVQPTQHEKVYRPVDKEVHQEHHHTTVQPIQDREVLPEKHSHINEGTEHKEFRHGDHDRIKSKLSEEQVRLGIHENTRDVAGTVRTQAEAPTAQGEHVHHHIHEHVQPVIEKEVIQPHVVHRTKAIHEVHQFEPQHHGASTLPPVTIDEFKRQGGHIEGETGVRRDEFRGEPRPVESGYIGGDGARGTTHLTRAEGHEHGHGHHHESGTLGHETGTHGHDHAHGHNATGTGLVGGATGPTKRGTTGVPSTSSTGTHQKTPISDEFGGNSGNLNTGTGFPTGNKTTGTTGNSAGHINPTTGTHISPTNSNSTNSSVKKASLLDKLNPKVDSNGDGKAGFMK